MSEPERTDWIESGVAIIGMAGRFPGAPTVDAFWRNLRDGVESVVRYDDEALRAAGVPPSLIAHPDYVKAGAPLADMELFDAGFFGFSPLDASILDPQHRHFLECSWEAMEAAGYAPGSFEGSVGVFAGSGHNAYLPYNLLSNPELVERVGFFLLRHTGNDKDFLTTRVSYLFDLRGPSVNVQTACSTSLVSVHMACQSLLNGECDMALAGGVTLELPHRHGYLYREGEILAPDGHCRAFDARSHGTVFGSGVGVVVLRRLADALRERDPVLAVVRGSAVNNDGAGKVGYLAPSVDGQATSVAEAIAVAGVSPESIGYVETHGTGTAIGDPIELAALTQAFRQGTQAKDFCAIGSVKPNIGHLDTAAGVASLIKTTLALRHRQLPPSLHFESPNPEIDFASSPFVVNASLRDWPAGAEPRRAGVSSLGVGGTNAHVILEEASGLEEPSGPSRSQQLLLLSARSEASLDAATDRLARHLREHPEQDLADVAHTLRVGRRVFEQRRMLVCRDREDAARALESGDPQRLLSGKPARERRRVAFLFPGGGAQYPNMGREIYETEPVYRSAVDECLALLEPRLREELQRVLFPAPEGLAEAAERFERPSLQLPALFIVEWAMAKLWMAWGIEPTALVGHSMGENTAACLSGVFRLADALALVSLRGRLFEQVPAGAMLAIPLSADEVTPLLPAELSLASINAPELCAASGPIAAIDALAARLAEREVETRRVKIQIAAHSTMLDPILPEWRAFLAGLPLSAPRIPFVSNLTGTWVRPEEATDPEYWVRHLRGSVRFADGVRTLCEDPDRLLLEVGPGRTLATLARLHPARTREQPALHSLRHPEDEGSDLAFVLGVLGQLWMHGAAPDWQAFAGPEIRRRVTLPTYAWDHQRHWIAPGKQLYQEGAAGAEAERRADLGEWFYAPDWRVAPLPKPLEAAAARRVLVFAGETPLAERILALLRARGDEVICVRAGAAYAAQASGEYLVRPGALEDYAALLGALAEGGRRPAEVLHLWNLGGAAASLADLSRARDLAFTSLFGFAQAVGSEDWTHALRMLVVSSGMQEVAGEGVPAPLRALLLGPCRVIPREYPNLRCASVDVAPPEPGGRAEGRLAEQLLDELRSDSVDVTLAYRGRQRLVQRYEPCPLGAPKPEQLRLRSRGVYLVTGGLGGLGLALARHLATRVQARLVLLGRTPLPPRETWPRWLESHSESDRTSRRLREIAAIEAAGGEVMTASADVLDPAQLRGVVEAARARFGALHGVIHAAGVLDDGLIQFKTAASAERVLAPKVAGTLALDAALEGVPLDFLVLYSSLSALAGLPGQIDYTAANAFLDAFAQHRSAREASPTLSIGWGAWQEVGIAAELLREAQGEAQQELAPTGHPFLERCLRDGAERQLFATRFDTASHWLVGEHRILDGTALIPGTGYLELARAALATRPEPRAIEIRDTFLMLPFVVQDGAPRELRLDLDRSTGDFAVTSQDGGAPTEHVRGTIGWADDGAPDKISLEELRARCAERSETHQGLIPQAHLRFGPRWACVRRIDFGQGEALALLELPEDFAADLELHALHPALLDMATGCAHALIPEHDAARDFYVPMSYARLLMRAPLPRRFFSHLRLRADHRADRDFAIFDATLYDESGVALVEIEEFMLKRMAGGISLAAPAAAAAADAAPRAEAPPNPLLAQLGDAIRPAEGMQAFDRLLAAPARSQIVVSPLPLGPWIAKLTAAQGTAAAAPRAEVSPELLAELAATEAVLLEHPAVAEAAVTAHFDRPGEKRLLAHVVWRADHPATVSELRRFLRDRLSADRLPQNFVELEALPRGSDGALERAALRDPFGRGDDYVAPRSEVEKAIARIWQEILGIERVGLHDNFFDIGGHSLLAMRAIVRTEKKLGARLNNAIMVLQTLEQVAAECSRRAAGQGRTES
jgi:acyl transferase domain-containing protein